MVFSITSLDVTISSVKGYGSQKGYTKPEEIDKKMLVRTFSFAKLEFVVIDSVVEPLIEKIIQTIRTGDINIYQTL